jgi:2-polyprenyl-3-methyl-5-hydroxy-6-metoxy-1,4-benzoquinol methylase
MINNGQPEDIWGYGKRLKFFADAIRKRFGDRAESEVSILDIGCGTGEYVGLPLGRNGFTLLGIDLHEPSIDAACRSAVGLDNARFLCKAVGEIDEVFDVVILSEVLEHLERPETLLADGLRRLKPDGLLLVTVPNGYGEFEWDSWLFRNLGFERLVDAYIKRKSGASSAVAVRSSTENQDDRHVQFFTAKRLEKMFAQAGLKIIDRQPSTLASGPFASHFLGGSAGFIDWNARVVDGLPFSLAGGWYFALRRAEVEA